MKHTTQGVQPTGSEHSQRRDATAAQKAALAAQMRAAKSTYEQIARQVGYESKGSAYHAVQRELKRIVVENIEELRREELATLDLLQRECMAIFLDKNAKGRLFAVDRILAVMERRARLMGLDQDEDDIAVQQIVVREVPANWLLSPMVIEAEHKGLEEEENAS